MLVMTSSVIPSLKYSWSGSPLRFVKGSTAMRTLTDVSGLPPSWGRLASRNRTPALTARIASIAAVNRYLPKSAVHLDIREGLGRSTGGFRITAGGAAATTRLQAAGMPTGASKRYPLLGLLS